MPRFVLLCSLACLFEITLGQAIGFNGGLGIPNNLPIGNGLGPGVPIANGLALGNSIAANGVGFNNGCASPAAAVAANIPLTGVPAGYGDVAVTGELPVGGTTAVVGNVPIVGFVTFEGIVPANGMVSLASNCECNSFY